MPAKETIVGAANEIGRKTKPSDEERQLGKKSEDIKEK